MYNNFIAFDDSVVVISRNTSGTTASAFSSAEAETPYPF